MPRVNGVMQLLPNVYGAPGGTVASDPYNRTLDDFVADANNARPLGAGGTGATNAADALTNLGGVGKATMDEADAKRVNRAGDQMKGQLTSAVIPHGTLGAVTEEYKYANSSTTDTPNGSNTHSVTVNAGAGTHTINPTGLVEGGVMQINVLYQTGSIAVSGTTQWELGGGAKSANMGDVGVVLAAGAAYRIVLEIVAGVRTGVFQ